MRRLRGFTLVEMLVVLMLVGLLVALVFDALTVFRVANERIAVRSFDTRETYLVRQWFNESVAGLRVADEAAGAGQASAPAFEGGPLGFRGTSLQPLQGGAGIPARVAWRFDPAAGQLLYQQADGPVLAFPSPEGLTGFFYFDGVDTWHTQWPPRLGEAAALPAAVAWSRDTLGGQRLSPVAVLGPRNPVYHPFQAEQE